MVVKKVTKHHVKQAQAAKRSKVKVVAERSQIKRKQASTDKRSTYSIEQKRTL